MRKILIILCLMVAFTSCATKNVEEPITDSTVTRTCMLSDEFVIIGLVNNITDMTYYGKKFQEKEYALYPDMKNQDDLLEVGKSYVIIWEYTFEDYPIDFFDISKNGGYIYHDSIVSVIRDETFTFYEEVDDGGLMQIHELKCNP